MPDFDLDAIEKRCDVGLVNLVALAAELRAKQLKPYVLLTATERNALVARARALERKVEFHEYNADDLVATLAETRQRVRELEEEAKRLKADREGFRSTLDGRNVERYTRPGGGSGF